MSRVIRASMNRSISLRLHVPVRIYDCNVGQWEEKPPRCRTRIVDLLVRGNRHMTTSNRVSLSNHQSPVHVLEKQIGRLGAMHTSLPSASSRAKSLPCILPRIPRMPAKSQHLVALSLPTNWIRWPLYLHAKKPVRSSFLGHVSRVVQPYEPCQDHHHASTPKEPGLWSLGGDVVRLSAGTVRFGADKGMGNTDTAALREKESG